MTRFVLLLLGLAVPAPTGAAPTTTVSLPQAKPTVPVRYQFGALDPASHPWTSHVFVLRNAGPASLTLGELDTPCRCTTAALDTPDGLPLTLAPGQEAAVHVTVTFDSLRPGPLTKDVWVYLQGHDRPLAVLELTGILRPAKIVARSPVKSLDRRPAL